MAEFLWTFAVQEVLKKILKLGLEQIGLAWGLEKELSTLEKGLLYAQAILQDINGRKLHLDSVRLWVKDLENIVQEADDLLDKLVYEDRRRTQEITGLTTKVCDFLSPSNNPFLFRYKMAKKMNNTTQTLDKHNHAATPLGLVGADTIVEREIVLKKFRETASNVDFEVVGRETELVDLLKLVIGSSNEHLMSVIPIVGMGGLGKTTLAKMLFNHDEIKRHFDQTIWVCVSKPFIVVNILNRIYEGLTHKPSGLNTKEALLQRLREEMHGKKYFLVLDDVWDEETLLWDELIGFLKRISEKSGNSIVVTTRSEELATTINTISFHRLKKLLDDQCWTLFKRSANANELSDNSNFEILMKELLVKKIGGVPLVAKVFGGAVKLEDFEGDYESWMKNVETIVRDISKNDKDFVLSTLKLSVDCLPLHALKQCFAYCSNFPQDYLFKKDTLIQVWIAQGFIQPHQERENLMMEDIGEEYLNFLVSRSLFQDVIIDESLGIIAFKMHDLIHDIACTVSNRQNMESLDSNSWSGKQSKLRTLIYYNKELHNKEVRIEIVDHVCLRVLVHNTLCTDDLPISMCKLIHLRYLDISKFSLLNNLLLESLSKLYNLQTLKLGRIKSTESLPKNLRKLVNLRHLQFTENQDMIQMPSHMGKLIHLQTLSQFAVGFENGCKIEELGPLKNLKGAMSITNLQKVKGKEEATTAKLVEKKNLRHLTFEWNFSRIEVDNYNNLEVLKGLQPHKNLQSLRINHYRGEVFPNGIFVENLVQIHLSWCVCEALPMLGHLPNLEDLWIYHMNSVRSIGNEFYGIDSNQRDYFPQLKKLHIEGMKELEQWNEATVESNLFGSLKTLYVFGCGKLKKLPNRVESCNTIEDLSIHGCPNLMLNVKNLQNLKRLNITGLKTLAEGLAELTNLKEMSIRCTQNYDFSPFIHLCSLTELGLYEDCSSNNARSDLPQQLEHLTSLRVLDIGNFDGLEALPEWLGKLTSLRKLGFHNCQNLKQLPSREAILCLTKLDELVVSNCPQLLVGKDDEEGASLPPSNTLGS